MSSRSDAPGRDTAAYRILALTAICGELPVHLLPRLPGGSSYKPAVITALKRDRLLRTYYDSGLRAYRLTAKAKALLRLREPERFLPALTGSAETGHIRSEPSRRLRLHRIAEATVTMLNAGVRVFPDEKADLFAPVWQEPARLPLPTFYNSREIKAMGTRFVKIQGARSVGVLLTDRDIFVTYDLTDSRMKWSYQAELRTRTLMKAVLTRERLAGRYSPGAVQALLLGKDMALAQELLAAQNDRRHFLLDGSYEHFHYLTSDRRGERLLALLCDPELSRCFREILLDGTKTVCGPPLENDGFDESGEPVLLGYTCDLPRIKRFDTGLILQEKTGTLICFDYQAEVLQKCCSRRVRFQTIDFQKWERSFFARP